VLATYSHNAFRQRVKKTVGGATTLFAYDEAGNLAGEYSGAGVRVAEHVYLGNLPIGVAFSGSPAINAVHADYLGTPRVITNGATVVWKWESKDPFGANLPSVQSVVYNQRFPGQYYDNENGLHYNWHRTYDPSLGRYVQPDPLGLAAGKNPFNYANQNPLNATDRDGLYSQIIWIRDSHGIDHLAIRLVNQRNEVQIFSFYMAGNPFGGANVPGMFSDQDFHEKYNNSIGSSTLSYKILTLNTTRDQEALLSRAIRGNFKNYSILDRSGDQCASFVNKAFSALEYPKINRAPYVILDPVTSTFFGQRLTILPSEFIKGILADPFWKNKIILNEDYKKYPYRSREAYHD
jgi:RHS repeat-associated protein